MKTSELTQRLLRGGCFIVGEYRVAKAETITYRDKITGKSAQFASIGHHIETGNEAVTVQERVPDGADISKFTPPHKKGQQVVVTVSTLERVGGFLRATGSIEPVEGAA